MIRSFLNAFAFSSKGIAAVEFAMILPVAVTLLAGVHEVSTAFLIDRKVTRATTTGADLVAQEIRMTRATVNDTFTAMQTVLQPFPTNRGEAHLRITSVFFNPQNNSTEVRWSEAQGGDEDPIGAYVLPPGLVTAAGESVIVGHVIYKYKGTLTGLIKEFTLEDKAYLRPRRSGEVGEAPN